MHEKTKKAQLQHSTTFHILPECYTLYIISIASASITVAFRKRLPVIDHCRNAYRVRSAQCARENRLSQILRFSIYASEIWKLTRNFFHLCQFVSWNDLEELSRRSYVQVLHTCLAGVNCIRNKIKSQRIKLPGPARHCILSAPQFHIQLFSKRKKPTCCRHVSRGDENPSYTSKSLIHLSITSHAHAEAVPLIDYCCRHCHDRHWSHHDSVTRDNRNAIPAAERQNYWKNKTVYYSSIRERASISTVRKYIRTKPVH